jgi:[FeFe] hydrogenase (group B1/B3)
MDWKVLETTVRNIRQNVLVRVIKAFDSKDFPEALECCLQELEVELSVSVFHDCSSKSNLKRICREKILAALGFSVEEDDGTIPIKIFAQKAITRKSQDGCPLTVLRNSCDKCPNGNVFVTDICRDCVAKPCTRACKFEAIERGECKMHIEQTKCKRCGLCIKACPYAAIAKTRVPCECACPVDAIRKSDDGTAHIDFERCIFCGKCIGACPFGALYVKSQLIDVLQRMKEGFDVIALPAPAFAGQFLESQNKAQFAIKKSGFKFIYEVAIGAEETARVEAKDFQAHMANGQKFMTTSCCAAYNELVAKHLQIMQPYVSHAKTPLYYTAEFVKKQHPEAIVVFFSPCFAKFREGFYNSNVEYVLSFEDVMALLDARGIDISKCDENPFELTAAKEAREFSISGGVSRSVQAVLGDKASEVQPVIIDGISKESIATLRTYAEAGQCSDGNLIEVMSCPGGCIGGNAAACPVRLAKKNVQEHAALGPNIGSAMQNKKDQPQ